MKEKKIYRKNLGKSKSLKNYLNNLIHDFVAENSSELDIKKFRAICYAINIMSNVIQQHELNDTVEKIVDLLKKDNKWK